MDILALMNPILNILGLSISIGGLVAARAKKQTLFLIVAAALVVTTGTGLMIGYVHQQQIRKIQETIKTKLAGHSWTFERIYSEVNFVPYKALQEALFLAVDSGQLGATPIECSIHDGTVLSTRIYYVNQDSNR